MNDWQKGFLGGLVVGCVGLAPLLLWLADIRARFRCPNCDEHISIHKDSCELVPQLETLLQRESVGAMADESDRSTKLSIAVAPTV